MVLSPDAARFELRDGTPVITLAVEPPAELATGDWSALNRLTLFVIDGPGDAGFLLPRLGAGGDVAPTGWDEAVERTSGVHVVFGTGVDAPGVFARSFG